MCVALLAGAVAVSAQVPQPGRGTSARERPKPITSPVFEFRSNFWINLHHFLYQQARVREDRPIHSGELPQGEVVDAATGAVLVAGAEDLRPEEQRAWNAAVDYYAGAMARRDLLFDGGMVLIKNRLAELGNAPDLSTSGLRREMVAALEGAAPVYRAHWWAAHDRANREWIAAVEPLVRKLGPALGAQLVKVYQAEWPQPRVPADVTVYAGRVGAYTSLDPLHVTIASTDPRNQGEAALEVVFHEASHGLATAVREAINRECRQRNKPTPRDLWHALLFYTTGEAVRRALAAERTGNYTPYAYRHGLYVRGWENFQSLLERHWQPYLDGRIEFDRAIARMATAL